MVNAFISFVKSFSLITLSFVMVTEVLAEPWIDTRDVWLRSDIERLSQAGVITVPINTWPLMWSGILNDLESTDIGSVPEAVKGSYARVLGAGKKATRSDEYHRSARLSVATESQLFRHFGDNTREEGELSLRSNGMSDHFAWNIELARVQDPLDGEDNRYDHSYLGLVLGNWIVLGGRIEKWWGPGWSSNLSLTNNARPPLGFTLQRNYSDPFDYPVLKWLGPWTTNLFISELDDQRVINDAKLVGMTVGFRPHQSVELNLRRTAQWGGEGRPQSFSNFIKLVLANSDNCPDLDCKPNEPGNQLAGADFRWDIPWFDGAVYGQMLGEDGSGSLPSKRAYERGFQYNVHSDLFEGMVFVEYSNTSTSADPEQRPYNVLYNHSIYQTGYRYEGRSIGATWDNDSKVTSIGVAGHLFNGDKIEARFLQGDLNEESINGAPSLHSITTNGNDFSMFSAKWQRSFHWGDIEVQSSYADKLVDEFGRQDDKFRVSASLVYRFE